MSQYVTLVNRTSRQLNATWDGRQYKIAVGESMLPRFVAEAAKRQNPIMGTLDEVTMFQQYLLGIKEDGDDCSPREQTDNKELLDRATSLTGQAAELIRAVGGLYSRASPEASKPQPDLSDTK